MEIIDLSALDWVNVTWDEARDTEAASIAFGLGEAHVRVLRMEAGGEVGEHETGSGQLLVPIDGSGWVREGGDQRTVEVGSAAYLPRGVIHAKGSERLSSLSAVARPLGQLLLDRRQGVDTNRFK